MFMLQLRGRIKGEVCVVFLWVRLLSHLMECDDEIDGGECTRYMGAYSALKGPVMTPDQQEGNSIVQLYTIYIWNCSAFAHWLNIYKGVIPLYV